MCGVPPEPQVSPHGPTARLKEQADVCPGISPYLHKPQLHCPYNEPHSCSRGISPSSRWLPFGLWKKWGPPCHWMGQPGIPLAHRSLFPQATSKETKQQKDLLCITQRNADFCRQMETSRTTMTWRLHVYKVNRFFQCTPNPWLLCCEQLSTRN